MRVGIIQPNYVPWRGYFDFIDAVDVFILLDDVQYTKQDWRNRNQIKTAAGKSWLSVPIRRTGLETSIAQAEIDGDDWIERNLALLRENYRGAPWYAAEAEGFEAVLRTGHRLLCDLNQALIVWAMNRLGITTRLVRASSLAASGGRTARLIELIRAVGGTDYLSGPSAAGYLDVAAFRAAGIGLQYKSYDYPPYPQLWGPFDGAVSILDMLFNTGSEARGFLKSRVPDARVS